MREALKQIAEQDDNNYYLIGDINMNEKTFAIPYTIFYR